MTPDLPMRNLRTDLPESGIMRVEGGSDNPANSDFTFPEIDEMARHPRV
jgi:hypothetical protein